MSSAQLYFIEFDLLHLTNLINTKEILMYHLHAVCLQGILNILPEIPPGTALLCDLFWA